MANGRQLCESQDIQKIGEQHEGSVNLVQSYMLREVHVKKPEQGLGWLQQALQG